MKERISSGMPRPIFRYRDLSVFPPEKAVSMLHWSSLSESWIDAHAVRRFTGHEKKIGLPSNFYFVLSTDSQSLH